MTERQRLTALREAGLAAMAGLRAVLAGPEIVVEDGPPEGSGLPDVARPPEVGGPEAAGTQGGDTPGVGSPPGRRALTAAPTTHGVGSPLGRRALAAAAHAPGLARRLPPAPGPEGGSLPGTTAAGGEPGPPPTLAFYPAPELARLAEALGLGGEPLAPDGDFAADATARELAWLPLLAGWTAYQTLPGGRLLAVAGYRRAALVAFGAASGREPVWAPLGSDALAAALAPEERGRLYLEEPGRLRDAIAAGRVRRALLGGDDLAWALGQPGARAVRPLTGPGLDWMPVWGLFSRGAQVALPAPPPAPGPHLVLVPAAMAPELTGWLAGAVVT